MKPGFALSLSFEGISLLHRAAGGWRTVGEVSLGSSDLSGDLTTLKDKAGMLTSGALRSKIIIPNDQIRYIEVETGSFSGDAQIAMVRRALGSATPYPVEDLAFDISNDGPITYVAAVARETLVEAEAFAVEHGFNPVSFVAAPGDNPYLGEPFFGPSAYAAALPDAPKIEPDGIAVVVIGPADIPEPKPEPTPSAQPGVQARQSELTPDQSAQQTPPAAKAPAESDRSAAVAGFASRRGKSKRPDSEPDKQGTPPSLAGALRHSAPPPTAKPALVAFKSSNPRAEMAEENVSPTPQVPEPELPISVTSPTLDIPDSPEPKTTVVAASRIAGFLSRRNSPTSKVPVSTQTSVPNLETEPKSGSTLSLPEAIAVSPSPKTFGGQEADSTSQAETARMTVFGARESDKVGGKPRYLGLILAVALLVFLAVVAVWASIFLEDGVAGLFRSDPDKKELAAVPDTPGIGAQAGDPAPNMPAENDAIDTTAATIENAITDTTPGDPSELTTSLALLSPTELATPDAPPLDQIAQPDQPPQPVIPAPPNLAETDSAVLEALRQAPQSTGAGTESPETPPSIAPLGANDASVTATAVMPNAPQIPDTPTIIALGDLYVASIDRTDLSQDAVALPSVKTLTTDHPLGFVNSPTAAGTAFDLDRRGLVRASVEGTLNPDGVMIYLGRPAAVPPKVPTRFETEPEIGTQQDRMAGLRPRLRPDDLAERAERSNLGGLTRAELSGLRPKSRPDTHKQEAEQDIAPTAQAVVSSRTPKSRPRDFDRIVTAAVRPSAQSTSSNDTGAEQVASIAPRTVNPKIPSSASVARQATLNNAINLHRVNLIGVYGTPSNRRALVRLPSGRYKKVKVGDTVDGGRVVAIGESELRYQKSGRNLTLKMPRG